MSHPLTPFIRWHRKLDHTAAKVKSIEKQIERSFEGENGMNSLIQAIYAQP
jgi:hypothetical protein